MAKAKRPCVNLAKLKFQLSCEWGDCDHSASSMPFFMRHVKEHFVDFLPEGVTADNYKKHTLEPNDKICCLWRNCYYLTSDPILLIRHLFYHAFHTKIKGRGKSLVTLASSFPDCQVDIPNSNFLQELPNPFECRWASCQFTTDNIEAFFVHNEEHYDFLDGKTTVVCRWEGCNIMCWNKYRLRDHLIAHTQEKKFACHNCGNMFSNSTKFLDHLEKQVPLDDQNFQCSHCSKIFANQRLLRDHVRVHVNHYKCPLCDMTCHSPSNLRNHINSRHSEDRPFPCDFCGLGCRTKYDLLRHIQTHSQNHNLCCDFFDCKYKAKTTTSLRRHYQKEHLNLDPKKYCCHICQQRFTQGGKLTHHLKRKHKFKWPSGFSRFRYKEHEDGLYRLQTVRYESLEITEHFLNDKKQDEVAVEELQVDKQLTEVLQEQMEMVQESMALAEYQEEERGRMEGYEDGGGGRLEGYEEGGGGRLEGYEEGRGGGGRLVEYQEGDGGRLVEYQEGGGGRLEGYEEGGGGGGRLEEYQEGAGGRLEGYEEGREEGRMGWYQEGEGGRMVQYQEEEGGGDRLEGFDDMIADGVVTLGAEETVMHPVDDGGMYQVRLHDAEIERYQ
ncbi:histone H4 transcription factor-like isoform X1 [Apostichopus japonicus]|uniref:histone H4 transcription factor-like isoform X1 n=1 Tax=Stichopus japonicus TaxID=307972 RepID=UPI003AB5358D